MARKEAAIVGSGPAGLAAAMKLADSGFRATIFEKLPIFGGMPAYCIPEHRISKDSTKSRVEMIRKKGVEFVNKKVDSAGALLGEFDFVLLAIGAGDDAEMGIRGERMDGMLKAIEFLYKQKVEGKALVKKGEKVAVIGGGNCAIDAARVAARQEAKVSVIYRRTEAEMPAYKEEIEAAKKDKVEFEFLVNPVEFIGKKGLEKIKLAKMQLSNPDESGRRRPVPTGEIVEMGFEKAIIAIGQNQNLEWLRKEGVEIIDGYKVKVDDNYKTTLGRVYAAGDCVTGAKTIGEATRTAIAAANAIISCGER